MKNSELFDKVRLLHDTLVAVSTGTSYDDIEIISNYQSSRSFLIQNLKEPTLLPNFVNKYRDLPGFWGYIKSVSDNYAGRRQYLAEEFSQLFDYTENPTKDSPIDSLLSNRTSITTDYVHEIWQKNIQRRETDPEGAITSSRTLLEATCKYILVMKNVSHDEKAKLPTLYGLTAKTLNLAPSKNTEQSLKQILSGAISVVNGVASLRNKISDSHAINVCSGRPSIRHATLCVNIAGTIAEFLISSFEQLSHDK